MTALYSKGTGGNWSTLGTFNTAADGSGTDQVPTAADAVTVQAGDTVTLDTVGLSALTLAVSGTLTASTTATSDITVQQNATFASGSSCVLDMSAAAAYTCTVKIGGSGAGGFRWTFQDGMTALTLKGVAKTRVTRVNMAGGTGTGTVQITVDSTAGWANGDRICIATTDSGYTPAKSEVVTISGLSGNTFLATLAYAHADNAYVGNLSSNLIFTSAVNTSSATRGGVLSQSTTSASAANTRLVQDVEFSELGNNGLVQAFELNITHQDNASWYGAAAGFKNNAIYNWRANGLRLSSRTDGGRHNCDIDTNVFAAVTTTDVGSAIGFYGGFYVKNSIKNTYSLRYGGIQGLAFGNTTYENLVVCSAGTVSNSQSYSVIGGSLFGNSTVFYTQSDTSLDNVLVGTEFGAYNTTFCSQRSSGSLTLTDCQIQTGGTIIDQWSAPMIDGAFVKFVNKNSDATAQEIYTNQSYTTPAIKRDNTTVSSSVSSVLMTCSSAAAITHKFGILAKASAALKILVYMRKSGTPAYGASTLPSITISGMGITPKTASMSAGTAADTWELVSLDLTSGEAPAVDGLLTVTLTAQSETAGAKAYFSGLPMAPFITRARHYGYLFDETSPTRTANATISAAFATADAYTGMAITWGASTSSIVLSADQTFQKLYDYSQAKAVANVASALMCTGAGVAGSPALFAGGAVTINDGFVLNGSGSISMGSYTLSTEFSSGVNYTYTGGTWSQLTTVPAFAGGTLNLGAAGAYTFTGSSMIISMTPTAPGTYSMGAGAFSGTIDLRNTTAHAITVEVPAGTTTTTANNTGGAITVSAPQIYQSVALTGLVAGSQVQIYDTTHSTELYNGNVAGTSLTWTDGTPAATSRAIRVRIANDGSAGANAYAFLETNIGTCGTTEPSNAISYLVSQTLDVVYNTNAIDGSTVTGITISPSPARVSISLAGGAVTWPEIYAYQVYWLATATGIADEAAFITAPDTANYLLTGFDIKNTSTTPLTITGGYGRDAVTGLVKDIIDVVGSSGNIYPAPDHAIPYSSGSGLTAGQAAQLTAIEGYTDSISADVLTTLNATAIPVNVTKVAGTTISGTGTSADPWGP